MSLQYHCVRLTIDELSKSGSGKGKWITEEENAFFVEVPFSIPGDDGFVHIRKGKKKGALQGTVVEWVALSTDRVVPRCKHFETCGGCIWQHIPYQKQIQQKEIWIQDLFRPFLCEKSRVYSIIACDSPWQYRNKMELTFSSDKQGKKYLGLIMYDSRGRVFQLSECHLMNPWMNDAVAAVRNWWLASDLLAYQATHDQGTLRTLTLREGQKTGDRMIVLTVSGNPKYALRSMQLRELVEVLQKTITPSFPGSALSIFLRIQQIAKGKKTEFFEMHLFGPAWIREILRTGTQEEKDSFEFKISPTAFFQPNTGQAEKLYSQAAALANISSNAIVYDLYCGTGTIGICLAKSVKKVVGIECNLQAALDAKENAHSNHIDNFVIRTGNVEEVLPHVLKEEGTPDVVFVDPPRAGLAPQALAHLLNIKSPTIVYISCNPATQAQNIQVLIEGGYQISALQPVDQFPHTIHVENIVVLERQNY